MKFAVRAIVVVAMTVLPMAMVRPALAQPPAGVAPGRGNYDPASFLTRMDRNNNGIIDVDEQERGAKFLIKRLSNIDSSIQEGRPIPLNTFVAAFKTMRENRSTSARSDDPNQNGGPGNFGGANRRGQDRGQRERQRIEEENEALAAELLVPGFGETSLPPLMRGFGAAADWIQTEYTERDLTEARDRVTRFDKNKNGFIDADEITPRFTGRPMDFDVNRDGRLSVVEMAYRQARKRDGKPKVAPEKKDSPPARPTAAPDLFGGRRSYRSLSSREAPAGVPGFFTDRDANGDNQVTMAEYGSDWTDELMAQFAEYDFNDDGIITAAEAIRSAEEGTVSTVMTGKTPAVTRSSTRSESIDGIDPKYVKYASRIIKRNDPNGDGVLAPSELEKMLVNPIKADTNRDGKVTLAEYATYLQTTDNR